MTRVETERLSLRRFRPEDAEPFAALNAHPAVMEHMPSRLTRAESDAMIARIEQHFEVHGFGLWAVDVRDGPSCIGFVGLQHVPFDAPFTPAVEVGWRLSHAAWGFGFASEAARAACRMGFEQLGLDEIVSITVPANRRSQAVMKRIGMVRDMAGDFEHPRLPPGHALRLHVLYRLPRPERP